MLYCSDGGKKLEIEKRTTIKIDPDIKRRLKSQAALSDLTLFEALEQALYDWLVKQERNKKHNE